MSDDIEDWDLLDALCEEIEATTMPASTKIDVAPSIPVKVANIKVEESTTSDTKQAFIYNKLASQIPSKSHKEKLKSLLESVDSFFPEEAWDFYDNSEAGNWQNVLNDHIGTSKYSLVLYYPKFEITNSAGNSHEIKEFYIILTFNSSFSLVKFAGCRGSVTVEELAYEYRHSHLKRASRFWTPGVFCTGDSTTIVSMCVYSLQAGFNRDSLDNLLAATYTFHAWESTEGVPYRRIVNITLSNVPNYQATAPVSPTYPEIVSIYNAFIAQVSKEDLAKVFSYGLTEKGVYDFGVDEIYLNSLLASFLVTSKWKRFVGIYSNSTFLSYGSNNDTDSITRFVRDRRSSIMTNDGIYFQGQQVIPTIDTTGIRTEDEVKESVDSHKLILNVIKHHLTIRIREMYYLNLKIED